MQNETDLASVPSYSVINFVIGLLITIAASVINALGLNVTKLDHSRQEKLPPSNRRSDYKRMLWWIGIILYISSQLLGSTLALQYLRAEFVAPLGATSLCFNVVFSYLLVGTPVTRMDIYGTLVIVLGVIGVVFFGNYRTPGEIDEENITLAILQQLWGRGAWIGYFIVGELLTITSGWLSSIIGEVRERRLSDDRTNDEDEGVSALRYGVTNRRSIPPTSTASVFIKAKHYFTVASHHHSTLRSKTLSLIEHYAQSRPDSSIKKLSSFAYAITGGLLAAQTLIFAKSIVKLLSSSLSGSNGGDSPWRSPLTWWILIVLVVAAVTQVYYLNASLRAYDSTFCIPIFFATYTIFGFINSLVYLNELSTYQLWTFLCIWASITILIIGVIMLSIKKPPPSSPVAPIFSAQDDLESSPESSTDLPPLFSPGESDSFATTTKKTTTTEESGTLKGIITKVDEMVDRQILTDERVVKSRGTWAQFVPDSTATTSPFDDQNSVTTTTTKGQKRGEGEEQEGETMEMQNVEGRRRRLKEGEREAEEEDESFGDFEEYEHVGREVKLSDGMI